MNTNTNVNATREASQASNMSQGSFEDHHHNENANNNTDNNNTTEERMITRTRTESIQKIRASRAILLAIGTEILTTTITRRNSRCSTTRPS